MLKIEKDGNDSLSVNHKEEILDIFNVNGPTNKQHTY